MAQVLLTRQADADLADIWLYIAQDNVAAADTLTGEIHDTFGRLAANPSLGIPQFQYRETMFCKPVEKRYLIFYEPIEDGIRVLRVLHGARNWERLI